MNPALRPFTVSRFGRRFVRFTAVTAAAGFAFTQALFAYAPEKSFWESRQSAARRTRADLPATAPTLLAQLGLPAAGIPVTTGLAGYSAAALSRLGVSRPFQDLSRLVEAVSSHGAVRAVYPAAPGKPLFLYIQDVHGNRPAQENIHRMLSRVLETYPNARVGLEGAAGPIDLAPLRGESVEANAEVGHFFFNTGYITGAELAAFTAPAEPVYFGLEQKDLYLSHVAAVKRALPTQDARLADLALWESKLTNEKKAAYTPDLLSLDQTVAGHRKGTVSLKDYLSRLGQETDSLGAYPNVARFLALLKTESQMNFAEAEKDRNRFLEALASKMGETEVKALIEKGAAFRAGAVPYAAFYEDLLVAGRKHGLSPQNHPAFRDYVNYVSAADRVSADALLEESLRLGETVWKKRARTPEERRVYALSRDLAWADKLIKLSLTPGEWRHYKETLQPGVHALAGRFENDGTGWPAQIADFEAFYDLALARDGALAASVLSEGARERQKEIPPTKLASASASVTLSHPRSLTPSVVVLVAGGFHTAGLTRLLKGKGTVLTVAPKMETVDPTTAGDYLKTFTRAKLPLDQLFESPKISLAGMAAIGDPMDSSTKITAVQETASSVNQAVRETLTSGTLARVQTIRGAVFAGSKAAVLKALSSAGGKATEAAQGAKLFIAFMNKNETQTGKSHWALFVKSPFMESLAQSISAILIPGLTVSLLATGLPFAWALAIGGMVAIALSRFTQKALMTMPAHAGANKEFQSSIRGVLDSSYQWMVAVFFISLFGLGDANAFSLGVASLAGFFTGTAYHAASTYGWTQGWGKANNGAARFLLGLHFAQAPASGSRQERRTLGRRWDWPTHLVTNGSGLTFELNKLTGGVGEMLVRPDPINNDRDNWIQINQIPANPVNPSLGNIYLRFHADDGIEAVPLTGPESESTFSYSERHVQWKGVHNNVAYTCAMRLDETDSSWYWTVSAENRGDAPVELDVLLAQDLALNTNIDLSRNSAYTSHYNDNQLIKADNRVVALATRNTQTQNDEGTSFAGLVQGALLGTQITGFMTEGADFLGSSYRREGRPRALSLEDIGQTVTQGELTMHVLQSNRVKVQPNKKGDWGFFAAYRPNLQPDQYESEAGKIYEQMQAQTLPALGSETGPASPKRNVFTRLNWLPTRLLSQDEYGAYFPGDHVNVESGKMGELLSFYTPEGHHVVTRTKEELVDRPHVAVLVSGRSVNPDRKQQMVCPVGMSGDFGHQVSVGNTILDTLFSRTRDYFNVTRSNGQRILVETASGWQQLGIPSAFEMGTHHARWIYALEDDSVIELKMWTDMDNPAVYMEISVKKGASRKFMISGHLAGSEREWYDVPAGITIEGRRGAAILPAEFVMSNNPNGGFYVATPDQKKVARLGGGEILTGVDADKSLPFLVWETNPVKKFQLVMAGSMDDRKEARKLARTLRFPSFEENIAHAREWMNGLTAHFRLSHDKRNVQAALDRVNYIVPFVAQNALVHYATPYGPDQPGAAAHGVRDLSQGPAEWLQTIGDVDSLRKIVVELFSHQRREKGEGLNAGDWPQWYMFDEYPWAGWETHADVKYFPILALARYLEAGGDANMLEEKFRFIDTGETETLSQHLDLAVGLMKESCVAGTALAKFGNGDWNDALQPTDKNMANRMVSSWTVGLSYQAATRLSRVYRRLNKTQKADSLDRFAENIKSDFNRHLIKDGVVAGIVLFDENGQPEKYYLHPSDQETGARYSLIAMTWGPILSDLFTQEQAARHMELVKEHLLFPDGYHLMDRFLKYKRGLFGLFKRAVSAPALMREVGNNYIHAGIRAAETAAHMGQGEDVWEALLKFSPILLDHSVPTALPRQANAYFTSSDADVKTRLEGEERQKEIKEGKVGFRGGWRTYSSGPGIYLRLLIAHFLGMRDLFEDVLLDPVVPESLDGLRYTMDYRGKPVEFIYKVMGPGGVAGVTINGKPQDISRREENPYRTGGVLIAREAFLNQLNEDNNTVEITLGGTPEPSSAGPSPLPHKRLNPAFIAPSEAGAKEAGFFHAMFQLRSKDNWGIGDFSAAKALLPFLKWMGYSYWQILALARSIAFSSPFSIENYRMLDPVFIGIPAIMAQYGGDFQKTKALIETKKEAIQALNLQPTINYEKARSLKLEILRQMWMELTEKKDHPLLDDFKEFLATDIQQGAVFHLAREEGIKNDAENGIYWELSTGWHPSRFPHGIRLNQTEAFEEYRRQHEEDVNFELFVQMLARKQEKDLIDSAAQMGIAIGTDMPFNPDAIEVVSHPERWGIDRDGRRQESGGVSAEPAYPGGQLWLTEIARWAHSALEYYRDYARNLARRGYRWIRADHGLYFIRLWRHNTDNDGRFSFASLGLLDRLKTIQDSCQGKPTNDPAWGTAAEAAYAYLTETLRSWKTNPPPAFQGRDDLDLLFDNEGLLTDHAAILVFRSMKREGESPEHLLPPYSQSPWNAFHAVDERLTQKNVSHMAAIRLSPDSALRDRGFMKEFLQAGDIRPEDSLRLAAFRRSPGWNAIVALMRHGDLFGIRFFFEMLGLTPEEVEFNTPAGYVGYAPLTWGLNPFGYYYPGHAWKRTIQISGVHDFPPMAHYWTNGMSLEDKKRLFYLAGDLENPDFSETMDRVNGLYEFISAQDNSPSDKRVVDFIKEQTEQGHLSQNDFDVFSERAWKAFMVALFLNRAGVSLLSFEDMFGLPTIMNVPGTGPRRAENWAMKDPGNLSVDALLEMMKDDGVVNEARERAKYVQLLIEQSKKALDTTRPEIEADPPAGQIIPGTPHARTIEQTRVAGNPFEISAFVRPGKRRKVSSVKVEVRREGAGDILVTLPLREGTIPEISQRAGLDPKATSYWAADWDDGVVSEQKRYTFEIIVNYTDGTASRSAEGRLSRSTENTDANPVSPTYGKEIQRGFGLVSFLAVLSIAGVAALGLPADAIAGEFAVPITLSVLLMGAMPNILILLGVLLPALGALHLYLNYPNLEREHLLRNLSVLSDQEVLEKKLPDTGNEILDSNSGSARALISILGHLQNRLSEGFDRQALTGVARPQDRVALLFLAQLAILNKETDVDSLNAEVGNLVWLGRRLGMTQEEIGALLPHANEGDQKMDDNLRRLLIEFLWDIFAPESTLTEDEDSRAFYPSYNADDLDRIRAGEGDPAAAIYLNGLDSAVEKEKNATIWHILMMAEAQDRRSDVVRALVVRVDKNDTREEETIKKEWREKLLSEVPDDERIFNLLLKLPLLVVRENNLTRHGLETTMGRLVQGASGKVALAFYTATGTGLDRSLADIIIWILGDFKAFPFLPVFEESLKKDKVYASQA